MSTRESGAGLFTIVALAAVTASTPFWVGSYYLSIIILTLVHIGLASAWNIVGGMAGQFSLGNSLFVGLGGTLVASLVVGAGMNPWAAMAVGALLSGLLALLISLLTFRLKLPHLSFALITLAFAEVGLLLLLSTDALGAASGVVWPQSVGFAEMGFKDAGFLWFALVVSLCIVGISSLLHHSKTGYYLRALRDEEDAAEAIGVDLLRYKTLAFVLSAMLTAVVATVYARYTVFVDPYIMASPVLSISVILYVVVGGLGTVWGPVLGAALLYPLGEILRADFGNIGGLDLMLFGVVIVIVVLYAPGGLMGLISRASRRLASRPATRGDSTH